MRETRENKFNSKMTDEDWFNLGKSDAWAGKPKAAPEHNSQSASMYDLGYSEGEIKHPPTATPKAPE